MVNTSSNAVVLLRADRLATPRFRPSLALTGPNDLTRPTLPTRHGRPRRALANRLPLPNGPSLARAGDASRLVEMSHAWLRY